MTKKTEDFEKQVAGELSKNNKYTVSHEGNNSFKSDIKIRYGDKETYVEVKMNKKAQLGSPRLKYEKGKWVGVTDNVITNTMSDELNKSDRANDIIKLLAEKESNGNHIYDFWIGNTVNHYSSKRNGIEYTLDKKLTSQMGSFENIYSVMITNYGNQNILEKYYSETIIDNITEYYKNKGALFAQVGDSFYKMSVDVNSEEYGFKEDVPVWKSTMACDVRFTFRKSKQWIEILPTIKAVDMPDSRYSLIGKMSPIME